MNKMFAELPDKTMEIYIYDMEIKNKKHDDHIGTWMSVSRF